MNVPENGRNGDIQVLRGVAVSMVMLQHYRGRLPAPDFYYGMFNYVGFWGGVDLFFAISGCVIMLSLANGAGDGAMRMTDWRAFWIRRLHRLLPAAWFWLGVSLALSLVLTSVADSDFRLVLNGALAAALGVANGFWTYCVSEGVVGLSCPTGDLTGIYWSLSLEEQFYLVLSAFLLVAPARTIAAIGLGAACVISLWSSPTQFSPSWSFRFLALVLGVWVAILFGDGRRNPFCATSPLVRKTVMTGAVCVVAMSPALLGLARALPVMAGAAALAVAAALPDGAWREGMFGAAMRWMGERSYSLYLCHLLAFLAFREVVFRTFGMSLVESHGVREFCVVFPLAIGFAVLLSHLSHRWIEEPWRRRGKLKATSPRFQSGTSEIKTPV